MSENDEMTTQQAQAVLRRAQQERWQRCQQEMDAVLAKYGCTLAGQPFISPDGRILVNVVMVDAPADATGTIPGSARKRSDR